MRRKVTAIISAALLTLSMAAGAQTLTLEQCREMALRNDKELRQDSTKLAMAAYDRKIAFANYLPNISASGAYTYNSDNIALINDDMSEKLTGLGTTVQTALGSKLTALQQAIVSNPAAAKEFAGSAMWQTVVGAMSKTDVSTTLNALGKELNDAFTLDIENSVVGIVSLQQPVFMGGKIIAANKMAKLAEELQGNQYDLKYQEVIVNVDQAYWQVVSIAAKKKLAESYADLLHNMKRNVAISVAEGIATASDSLQVEVKSHEADMLLTKAGNGLVLSKMLLCKLTGLPLDSQITLADENAQEIAMPQFSPEKGLEQIYEDRPETRSLDLATQIYKQKYNMARADMLPKVALTANYLMSNHNFQNGFSKEYGDMFSAGVMVNIPLFHGFEALNKTRKAKAEQQLYFSQLDDAKEKIELQVTQLRQQQGENIEKYYMARHNVESAEENLRKATIGYEEGVIDTDTALGAQTAWLQANSEFIDAGIDLQMNNAELLKAEGSYTSDRQNNKE